MEMNMDMISSRVTRLNLVLNLIIILTFFVILVKLEYAQTSISFILPISKVSAPLIDVNNTVNDVHNCDERSKTYTKSGFNTITDTTKSGVNTITVKLEDNTTNYGRFKLDKINKTLKYFPNNKEVINNEVVELLASVEFVNKEISKLTKFGFLNTHDLSKFPIFSDLITHFAPKDRIEYISGECAHISFNWLYNIIYLSIFSSLIFFEKSHGLDTLSETPLNEKPADDIYYDLIEMRKCVHQKLDPSVRKALQKRGVSLIQNIQCGFDTEYVNLNLKINKLLSTQLAQTVQPYLKLPIFENYELGYINPLTEVKSPVKRTKSFDFDLVEKIINNHVQQNRSLLFGELDHKMMRLIYLLKEIPYLQHQFKGDSIYIKLPTSPLRTKINIVNENGYSLRNLLRDSIQLSQQDIVFGRYSILDRLKKMIDKLNSSNSTIEQTETITETPKDYILETEFNEVLETEVNEYYKPLNEPSKLDRIKRLKKVIGERFRQTELFEFSDDMRFDTINYETNEGSTISTNDINDTKNTNVSKDTNVAKEEPTIVKRELKSLARKNQSLFSTQNRISVSYELNNIIIGHHTSSDLSLLSDFDEFKDELDVVNNSMITLGKGFKYGSYNVVIRDTMLLSPASNRSLASIGQLYNYHKLQLTDYEINHMDELLKIEPKKFEEYAMRDSLITLKHAEWMENFNFQITGIGIPTTLSSIGRNYVLDSWAQKSYSGYQLDSAPDYLIGEASLLQTPMGLSRVGDLGLKMGLYISNYKGGRNESFMYGIALNQNKWYDYDLVSAYTTVLSQAGHPDYTKGVRLSKTELKEKEKDYLLNSYTVIKCDFNFPDSVKYPSIPVYVDETTTVYPKSGKGVVLTGAEYLLAESQNCEIIIEEVYSIPFSKSSETSPFKDIIHEIQSKRREHPKGSIANLMYKEIGNSIYGSIVRGMSNKRKYDNKSKQTIRMKAHYLTNPVIASWTTAYIRSVIGECLNNVQKLGGLVVSVTTDGFITNLEKLEDTIISNIKCQNTNYLLTKFRALREDLSNNETSLELKNISAGIISWSTRGQVGLGSELRATTGFQNKFYTQTELIEMFTKQIDFGNDLRQIEYLQTSLRSAIDILKHGGHVTKKYKDQRFSLVYDNRREILDQDLIDLISNHKSKLDTVSTLNKDFFTLNDFDNDNVNVNVNVNVDYKSIGINKVPPFKSTIVKKLNENNNENTLKLHLLLDSKPLKDSQTCYNIRSIAKKFKLNEYNKRTSVLTSEKYKDYKDTGIRNFIKGILKKPPLYPDIASELSNYQLIIDFISEYDPLYKVSRFSLSKLKNRQIIIKQVPRTENTEHFIKYVKQKFPFFDESKFFNK